MVFPVPNNGSGMCIIYFCHRNSIGWTIVTGMRGKQAHIKDAIEHNPRNHDFPQPCVRLINRQREQPKPTGRAIRRLMMKK